jgi:leucyl-tRNA synthetase
MSDYNAKATESEIQAHWEKTKAFAVKQDDSKEKFYCLSMFPYPSGKLHMGHVRNYSIGDAISRIERMRGKNVLQPMGWDSFGLPAENAAIESGVSAAEWTDKNIEQMKHQLKALGFGYDWDREISTCSPEYYKHEQAFFIRLFEKGLVIRKTSSVNWDPVDNTVLANEQVIDGRGWRSKALVEQREVSQWFIKITEYADELLDGLDHLPDWPDSVKSMQRAWIGRSEGVTLRFTLAGGIEESEIEVYTTRPDTLFGVTALVLAPQHPLVKMQGERLSNVANFIEESKNIKMAEADIDTMDKTGVDTGLRAIHPISGELVPVWTGNFVLLNYGSGAVMAVPAHDKRDFLFAKKYGIEIRQVIIPQQVSTNCNIERDAFAEKGILINSGKYSGLTSEAAMIKIAEYLQVIGKGEPMVKYRLRDWGVSRQRYWGAPIPMAELEDGSYIPVPNDKLPVLLPEVEFDGGVSPIKTDPEWANTTINGLPATMESDTFDTFMQSSWYHTRYCSATLEDKMLDPEESNYWLPVDQYIGGIEHANMHLLYSRFFHKLLRDDGLVNSDEPFKKLLCQGMVLAESYYRDNANGQKVWINPADIVVKRDAKGKALSAMHKHDGLPVLFGGTVKMGKSINNGVDPQKFIDKYGADTIRLYILFAAPPSQTMVWIDSSVEGTYRFLKRLWRFSIDHLAKGPCVDVIESNLSAVQKELRRTVHKTISKVTFEMIERQHFNIAIAAIMELMKFLYKAPQCTDEDRALVHEAIVSVIKMLNPICPHICQKIWSMFNTSDLEDNGWPDFDVNALEDEFAEIVVQVDGKTRAKIIFGSEQLEELYVVGEAKKNHNVLRFIESEVLKAIYVPGKLVNLVTI